MLHNDRHENVRMFIPPGSDEGTLPQKILFSLDIIYRTDSTLKTHKYIGKSSKHSTAANMRTFECLLHLVCAQSKSLHYP
jgi:hypothetical protein